jgi:hypothetical protein
MGRLNCDNLKCVNSDKENFQTPCIKCVRNPHLSTTEKFDCEDFFIKDVEPTDKEKTETEPGYRYSYCEHCDKRVKALFLQSFCDVCGTALKDAVKIEILKNLKILRQIKQKGM